MERAQAINIAKAILTLAAAVTVMSAIAVAPGLGILLQGLYPARRVHRSSVWRSYRTLIQKGLLKEVRTSEGIELRLTQKGRERFDRYQLDDLQLPEPDPSHWDGKWRIVLFDIPEQRKHLRGVFRRKLQQLNFHYVQRSAWLYPFQCEEQLAALVKRLQLEPYVAVAISDTFSQEQKYLRRYRLTRTDQ